MGASGLHVSMCDRATVACLDASIRIPALKNSHRMLRTQSGVDWHYWHYYTWNSYIISSEAKQKCLWNCVYESSVRMNTFKDKLLKRR